MKPKRLRWLSTLSFFIFDVAGLILAYHVAFETRFHWNSFLTLFPANKGFPDPSVYNQALYALLPSWLIVFFYSGFYKEQLPSAYDEFIRVFKAVILCSLLTTAMSFSYRGTEYSRLVIGLWCLYSILLVYVFREINKYQFRRLLYWLSGPQPLLIIGNGRVVDSIRQTALRQPFVKTLFLPSVESEAQFLQFLRQHPVMEVLLVQGGLPTQSILEISRYCEHLNIECKIVPDILELRRGEIVVGGFLGLPTFHLKSLSLHGTDYILKRSFDIVLSLLVLTLCFFPLLLISFLIRLDTPGPILYAQERMGLRGRRFKFFKFRTMTQHADQKILELKHLSDRTGPVFKMKNDPRVTAVGRWMRQYSFDELPQIINVLRGDMSFVGPRPQVLWEAAHYDDTAKKRLRVMPGITGLWQVSGRAALSYNEMIDLDIYYLENWSLGLDLQILLRTIPAVFVGNGAY